MKDYEKKRLREGYERNSWKISSQTERIDQYCIIGSMDMNTLYNSSLDLNPPKMPQSALEFLK